MHHTAVTFLRVISIFSGNSNTVLVGSASVITKKGERAWNYWLFDQVADFFEESFQNLVLSCQKIYSPFGLAIHQNDHQARRRFVEWAQNEIAVVPDFHKRILFSDEAHFWLNGYVNKQNCCIWSEANPQVYVETPLHPEKLTVWCALWAGGIIGPYFFKNDEGHNPPTSEPANGLQQGEEVNFSPANPRPMEIPCALLTA
ncbi:hypothetical protein TNCV_2809261 [Trichonephila clavipes]|nr:hypothetical protein TNCV_2809261 [Trichonephila clavipes]